MSQRYALRPFFLGDFRRQPVNRQRRINSLRPVFLLWILLLITFLPLTRVAWAEDDALTAVDIRTLIKGMDDAGDPAACDGTWSSNMCSTRQAERKRCLALRKKILADGEDFVVRPVINTDKYDQRKFDKYAGKCRGTEFNKTYALTNLAESDKGLRLYVVRYLDSAMNDLLIFGRHYGHIEPYQRKEMEKAKAEGKQFFPPNFWRSLFSQLDHKDCRVHEIQEVHEPGTVTSDSSNPVEPSSGEWDYDKVSVIQLGNMYFIAEYHRFLLDKMGTPTLSIIKIEKGLAHVLGGAEHCDFQ